MRKIAEGIQKLLKGTACYCKSIEVILTLLIPVVQFSIEGDILAE